VEEIMATAKAVKAPKLSAADWEEIYYALDYKLTSPAVSGDKKWIAHLKAIMKTIGPDGDNMKGQVEAEVLAGGLDQDSTTADAYRACAKDIHVHEGTLEIDSNAMVSQSDDGGAYVQAWVWVYDDQAGVSRD